MKILVVSQHYYPENFRITDICETLVKTGHQVDVICGLPNYPEGEVLADYKHKKNREQVINGVNIHRCFEIGRGHSKIKLFLNYYSVCLSMLRKAKRTKEKYDLVFINQLSPVMQAWAGIAYAKKHKVPCIMYCYDLWPDSLAAGGIGKNNPVFKYFYKVSNKCYKKVDKLLVTSKSFVEYFTDYHHIDKDKIYYLPQFCEDLYSEVVSNNQKDNNEFNYVFAGNVGKMQSVETIIEAANLIKDDKSIKIHIVGDGSNLDNCKKLVQEYGLNNVVFYGRKPIEEMPKFYSMADAMLVTLSKNDVISKTLPGKVQSYMAAGKPIIAAIDGECQEILTESKCGFVCDSEDYESLSRLFIEFKTSNIEELKENSLNYFKENFTKDIFFDNLIKIINGE